MGKGTSASASQLPAPPPVAAPPSAALPKPPAAVPPVTERSIEVEAASRQTRVDAKNRKGLRSTLLAGETGGYTNPLVTPASGATKTLLG